MYVCVKQVIKQNKIEILTLFNLLERDWERERKKERRQKNHVYLKNNEKRTMRFCAETIQVS